MNLTHLFLKLFLPLAMNYIIATVISALVVVRGQKQTEIMRSGLSTNKNKLWVSSWALTKRKGKGKTKKKGKRLKPFCPWGHITAWAIEKLLQHFQMWVSQPDYTGVSIKTLTAINTSRVVTQTSQKQILPLTCLCCFAKAAMWGK